MILHIDIFVNSMEEMLEFYVDKFGMRVIDDHILSGELVRFVSNNLYDSYRVVLLKAAVMGTMLELIEYVGDAKRGVRVPESWTTITLLVPSIEDERGRLLSKGVKPLSKVFSVSLPVTGKADLIFYEDPEKNRIELLQMSTQ